MKTSTEREAEFRKDLLVLLNKHSAEMDIVLDDRSYGCGPPKCVISMEGSYDYEDDEMIEQYTEFEL